MKRFLICLGMFALLIEIAGCKPALPPADGSNDPPEVQEYEKRKKEEREAKAAQAKP